MGVGVFVVYGMEGGVGEEHTFFFFFFFFFLNEYGDEGLTDASFHTHVKASQKRRTNETKG